MIYPDSKQGVAFSDLEKYLMFVGGYPFLLLQLAYS
jgi:hypothetical protein